MYYASPGEMPAALLGRTRSSQALLDSPTVFLYRSPSEPKAVEFTVTADAVEQMNRAWLAENGGHGDREVGGWLLADKRFPDRIIGATDSTVEAADGALTMDNWYAVEAAIGEHMLVAGSWHAHPAGGAGVPSQTDLGGTHAHLLHLLDERDRDRTLDLICVPRDDGSLRLHGWA